VEVEEQSLTIRMDYANFEEYWQPFLAALRWDAAARCACALCTEPDVVLLDEPFSALDSQTRLALADGVTEILRREGKTVILITHDIGEAVSMAGRVIELSRRPGQVKSIIRFASHQQAAVDRRHSKHAVAPSSFSISKCYGRSSKFMSKVEAA